MPYIKENERTRFNGLVTELSEKIENCGQLNYSITKLLHLYLKKKGLKYTNCNEIMGVLNCVAFEFYRKVVAPYENKKINENGDV